MFTMIIPYSTNLQSGGQMGMLTDEWVLWMHKRPHVSVNISVEGSTMSLYRFPYLLGLNKVFCCY